MNVIGFPSWAFDWGWESFAVVLTIIFFGIFLVPWFLFLLNLHSLLSRVSDRNRAMPAGHVWLNFIPIFSLGWFVYTVIKVRDSVRAEYQSRGWAPDGDFGYNVGLATGVLAVVSFLLGLVPLLGWAIGIAQLVCWIIYWLKMSDLKSRLGERDGWQQPTFHSSYPPAFVPPTGPASPEPADQKPSSVESNAGQCAVCGTSFNAEDKYCRTCGLRLP